MQKLEQTLQNIDAQYQMHFAGHPRFSRDIRLIKRMSEEARAALTSAESAGLGELADRIRKQLTLFETETKAIEAVQSADTASFLAYDYRSWLDLIHNRYQRSFAGQSRGDRDQYLLRDLLDCLAEFAEGIAKLTQRSDHEVVQEVEQQAKEHQTLFQVELAHINDLRTKGDVGNRSHLLAGDANRIFATWKNHFANRPRISRRAERLEKMVTELKAIAAQMKVLTEHPEVADLNQKNYDICAQREAFYTKELTEIRNAKSAANFDTLVAELGKAASELSQQYGERFAGKPRNEVSLETLETLCEGLFDLAIQMNRLDLVRDHDGNQQNLASILDQLRLFHREFVNIKSVQEKA